MNNEEKLVKTLLAGVSNPHPDIKAAALIAIGDSGMIDEDRFIQALEGGAENSHPTVKSAAYAGMGRMLKSANRQ
ncbi:hypothetical protein [Aeromonas enteropelogenes]|uniref:hypothetical protein n=1 Tax=Aeromonas enteropelogenes TaxID=29489 RepID=UPI003BA22BF5